MADELLIERHPVPGDARLRRFTEKVAMILNSLILSGMLNQTGIGEWQVFLADGDYGDVTISSDGTTITIDAGVVSNTKLATMPAYTIKANPTAAVASPTDAVLKADISFAFGDATPKLLLSAPASRRVQKVELLITEVFNGTGAALTVGTAADADELMESGQNDPAALGTYITHPQVVYGTATNLQLTITPGGGASTGQGIVTITFQL